MPTLDPTRVLRYAMWGLLAVILGAAALRVGRSASPDNPAYDALSKALSRRIAADSLALDSARVALRAASEHVTRDVVRYRAIRDTLRLTDTVAVRETLVRADSVVRSCTELVESCARLRVRADSSIADLTLDRDRWKRATESLQPSRWDGVKTWAIRIGIGVGAFTLGQSVR